MAKIESVRKKEFHIGLDIGTRLIKCVEVLSDGNARKLTKFSFSEIDQPQTGETTLAALKSLLEALQPSVKEVNISLSAPSAIVRFINMPKMKKEDLDNSLHFEAEKYIPFNINEVLIDASILEENPDDKNQMRVLLAAAKKDAVNSRIDMLKKLGISVGVIDIDSFACFNAFCDSFAPSANSGPSRADGAVENKLHDFRNAAILNIGYSQTNIIISRGSQPFFTRDMQIGGKDIAAAISKGLGVEENDADRFIFDPKGKAAEIYENAKTVLENLVDETRLSFGYYENQFGKSVEQIYISGGVGRMDGIPNYFEESFNIKPLAWNPFSRFEIDSNLDSSLLELIRPQFAVCAGLAIRK